MKQDDAIGVLESLLPEDFAKNHAFPPGWGGSFSRNKEAATEVAELLNQFVAKQQSEKAKRPQKQAVEWLESVWSDEEGLRQQKWKQWVLECAKKPDELRSRVKDWKEERVAKEREKEEKKKRAEEKAKRQRLAEEEEEKRRAREARLEAQRQERAALKKQKEEAERRREAKEAEIQRRKDEAAEARREARRQLRAEKEAEQRKWEELEEKRRELDRRWAENAARRQQQAREHQKVVWSYIIGVGIAIGLLFGLWVISRGFDVPVAKTGLVWPWCWWQIKFVVGLGFVLNIILFILANETHPGTRDTISEERYKEIGSPQVGRFVVVTVVITLGMFIYALCHLFSVLGFSIRALGMGLLFIVEFSVVGMIGLLLNFLCNGLLWGRYE